MVLFKQTILLLLISVCLGCASKPVVLLNGFTQGGAPICLDDQGGIPAVVRKFYATRDLTTEEGKIDYLIERVRASDLIFLRNKVEYNGPSAASFLRWKLGRMGRHNVTIETAKDFVTQTAGGSRMSGQPYSVIFKDGSRHNLQQVLQNELDMLEACLKQPLGAESQTGGGETEKNHPAPATPADLVTK